MLWFKAVPRLKRLEEDLEKLRHDFHLLELEWDEAYDKIRKAMGRIVKSRAIVEAAEEREPTDGTAPTAGRNVGGFLTERQKRAQQEILRRRAGIGGGSV